MDLSRFDALTFDCYGTLIDWETAILDRLRELARARGLAFDDDALLVAFAETQRTEQRAHPDKRYRDLLRDCHARLVRDWGIAGDGAADGAFADSVAAWAPFADTRDALAYLADHYRLGVLSNVDRRSFAQTAPKLGTPLDLVVTAEDAGAYKPDRKVFDLALERLADMGIDRSRLLHVAQSRYHDIIPCNGLGIACVWIDRRRDRPGTGLTVAAEGRPDLVVPDLASLAALHRAQAGG